MDVTNGWIEGQALRDLLQDYVGKITQGTVAKFTFLHGPHTLAHLQNITRGAEDLINVDMVAWGNPSLRKALDQNIGGQNFGLLGTLKQHFDTGVSDRIGELLARITLFRGLMASYHSDYDGRFSGLSSCTDLANFLKSRRRHLNTLMYATADLARGDIKLSIDEVYYLAFETIERSFVAGLTGLHHKQTMLAVFPDFRCRVVGGGLLDEDPRSDTLLDGQYLEAERMSITDIESEQPPEDAFDRSKIMSVAELRYHLATIESSYAPYELGKRGFTDLRLFAEEVMAFTKDDYYLRIPADAFNMILGRYQHAPWLSKLVYRPVANHPLHGSHAAFAEHSGAFYSDLMVLMRFAYRMQAQLLEPNKRYPIKSGFIFEDVFKQQLPALGFEDLDIKRIEHKEFDVVAKRDGVLYNFQCKNVRLDHGLMETNLPQFVRNNRRIVRYFEQALVKEERRENLLLKETGAKEIKHYVLSRFPVFTDNPRIIAFRQLAETFG